MKAQIYNWHGWCGETEPDRLRAYYLEALAACGFKVLRIAEHHFTPQGYTALFLLAESHFAIHTFPEHSRTYLELSSCVPLPFARFTADFTADTTPNP